MHKTESRRMDALPASRIHLMIMGIDCNASNCRLIRLWNWFIRMLCVTLLVARIISQIIGLFFFNNVLLLNTAIIGIYSLQLLSYVFMFCKTKKLFIVLKAAIEQMDKKMITKIQAYDRRQSTITLVTLITDVVLVLCYVSVVGIGREASVILLGARDSFDPVVLKFLFLVTVFLCYLHTFMMQFYLSILFLTIISAKQMQQEFMRSEISGQPDYEMMQRLLQRQNKTMRTVNEEAAIMPLTLLSMEFVGFACAISFLVINSSEMGITIQFAALVNGAMNVLLVKAIIQLITLGNKCCRSMLDAWKIAEQSVAEPFFAAPCSVMSVTSQKALKFFLIKESIVPPTVTDNIVIDRSLILNFFNQLIPFTVMMFTTLNEFQNNATTTAEIAYS